MFCSLFESRFYALSNDLYINLFLTFYSKLQLGAKLEMRQIVKAAKNGIIKRLSQQKKHRLKQFNRYGTQITDQQTQQQQIQIQIQQVNAHFVSQTQHHKLFCCLLIHITFSLLLLC